MSENSSFIPRQNTQARSRKVVRKRIYILSYLTYIFFFGVLLVVGVIFFWQTSLQGDLAAQKAQLEAERAAFSQSDISQVKELDVQLQIVSILLDTHPSMYTIVDSLKKTTLQNIQLDTFTVNKEPGTDSYLVEFSGSAPDFSSLLYQRQVTASDSLLGDSILTTVTYGTDVSSDATEGIETPFESPIGFSMQAALPVSEIMANTEFTIDQPAVATTSEETLSDAEFEAEGDVEGAADIAPAGLEDIEVSNDIQN